MQLCCAEVRLGGSLNNTVPKTDLTPAEILILRHIHGEDAVVNIRPTGDKPRSSADEYERLKQTYGNAGHMSVEGQPSVLLDRLFPGAIKKLPGRLKDIGLGHIERPSAAPPARPAQQEGDDHGDEDEGGREGEEAGGEGDNAAEGEEA